MRAESLRGLRIFGWAATTIFGMMVIWIIIQVLRMAIFRNISSQSVREELEYTADVLDSAVNHRLVLLLIAGVLALLATIGAVGIVRLKYWGLILYQSVTTVIAITLLSSLFYYILARYNEQFLIDGIGLLLISLILLGINIFLSKKSL
jgi:hypothetical protein